MRKERDLNNHIDFDVACNNCGEVKQVYLLNPDSIIFTNCAGCYRGMHITVENGVVTGVLMRDSKQIQKGR